MAVAEVLLFAGGIAVFSYWLLNTSFGRNSLSYSVPRRNNMAVYLPFFPLFAWVLLVSVPTAFIREFEFIQTEWKIVFAENIFLSISAIVAIGLIIYLARKTFARRLKGFGLDNANIARDFAAAMTTLFAVWPIIVGVLLLTIYVGQLIWGPDFQIQRHEELEIITKHSQLSVKIVVFVTAVLIVPVFEEMLFRGLFQSLIRSLIVRPWVSILATSVLFSSVHANAAHWPALFALSVCMGYSYEKSGSLYRPIFIHSLFNAISVIATLSTS